MYDSDTLDFFIKTYESAKNEHLKNRMDNIKRISPYTDEINYSVFTISEIELYIKWQLCEKYITRTALIAPIDPNYINAAGESNLQRMLNGDPPFDPVTGDIIVLHHIGQNYDSPFAEIPRLYHSKRYYSALHKKHIDSWRADKMLIALTKTEFFNHWQIRGKMYL